ncbi:hypothetical protein QNH39_24990 [Neobacillus novalis]|uniref:Uncharacterized protein n=1 Tax=Neobacillus novalis TaxID=220687 RepID=A0AA95MSL2_9BACI|nr:DUF6560 family protein [Neobacillus novalis]WHY85818.1 hypothetical protein QNH39_24990 [Neobacillus novalis]
MPVEVYLSISIICYFLGFIVNRIHDQVFSGYSLHIRWWFSTITIVCIMNSIGSFWDGIEDVKMAIRGLLSSIVFLYVSWKTRRGNEAIGVLPEKILFGLLKWFQKKLSVFQVQEEVAGKNEMSFSRGRSAIVRIPNLFKWLAFLFTLGIMAIVILSILFPDNTEDYNLIGFIVASSVILFGSLATIRGFLWRIDVSKDSDMFVYRTSFGRTYQIPYNEITYYKTQKHLLTFKYRRKIFIIHTQAINYSFFIRMLIEKNVKKVFKKI